MAESVWLVTGGSGQVGGALASAPPAGVRIVAPGRDVLDLSAAHIDIAPLLKTERVTAIINCAAYTRVDQAEDEPELAQRINAEAPGALARAAAAAGLPIVQISTDYVFPGGKDGPYLEDDPTGPKGVYGSSKLAGELAVAASGARHAILRTAWVFSAGGSNFVRTMLRVGRERSRLTVVSDQHGCPTHAGDLASAIARVAQAFEAGYAESGIWHATNAGETTWHGFAEHIFARAARHGRPAPMVEPIATADYPTKAVRPGNSRLSNAKLQRDFGIALRPWQAAVDEAVDAIIAQDEKAGS